MSDQAPSSDSSKKDAAATAETSTGRTRKTTRGKGGGRSRKPAMATKAAAKSRAKSQTSGGETATGSKDAAAPITVRATMAASVVDTTAAANAPKPAPVDGGPAKPAAAKPAVAKVADAKPADPKPTDIQPAAPKSAPAKPTEIKAEAAKSAAAKAALANPARNKPAPEKSNGAPAPTAKADGPTAAETLGFSATGAEATFEFRRPPTVEDAPKAAAPAPTAGTEAEDAKILETSDSAPNSAPERPKGSGGGGGSVGGGSGGSDGEDPAPADGSRASGGSPVFVGAIGGVIGALLALLLAPLLSAVLPDSLALVREASVAQRFAAADTTSATQTQALDGRLADVAEATQTVEADVRRALDGLEPLAVRDDAFAADLDLLRGQIDAMNAATLERQRARDDELDALRTQISALAAAMNAVPPVASGGGATASAAVETRLANLEAAVRRLDARLNGISDRALPTPDLSRVDLLETRVRALEARPIGGAGDAALGVSFASLAQAVTASAAFERELETFERVADVEAPPALGNPAANGLPSMVSLVNRFRDASYAALRASVPRQIDEQAARRERAAARTWRDAGDPEQLKSDAFYRTEASNRTTFDWFYDAFSKVVVTGSVDEIGGDGPDAIISRASARLEEGDLAAALAELDALPQVGRNAMNAWLRDARARADAEAALAEWETQLLAGQ